jgi:hypothetical protein
MNLVRTRMARNALDFFVTFILGKQKESKKRTMSDQPEKTN